MDKGKKFIPEVINYYQKNLKCLHLEYGLHIIQKAKGCKVWDLDGREYYDFATMGIGVRSLGYADPDVDTRSKCNQ